MLTPLVGGSQPESGTPGKVLEGGRVEELRSIHVEPTIHEEPTISTKVITSVEAPIPNPATTTFEAGKAEDEDIWACFMELGEMGTPIGTPGINKVSRVCILAKTCAHRRCRTATQDHLDPLSFGFHHTTTLFRHFRLFAQPFFTGHSRRITYTTDPRYRGTHRTTYDLDVQGFLPHWSFMAYAYDATRYGTTSCIYERLRRDADAWLAASRGHTEIDYARSYTTPLRRRDDAHLTVTQIRICMG
jgi:hypothetical protein